MSLNTTRQRASSLSSASSIHAPAPTTKSSNVGRTMSKEAPQRVFLEVSVPRHPGLGPRPRLSLADVDPNAAKAFLKAKKDKEKNVSGAQPTKENNAVKKNLKRTRSDEDKHANENEEKENANATKKRKIERGSGPVLSRSNSNNLPGAVKPRKLDTTTKSTLPPTKAPQEVKKVVLAAKKPLPVEPQPLWTRVGVDFTRQEVEDRILLREFVLRFKDCLDLKRIVLEKLEDFADFDDATAKALLLAFVEVVRADAPSDSRRALADFVKQIRARSMSFYDILCTMDSAKFRTGTGLHVPPLTDVLEGGEDEVDSTTLIPVLLGLVDDVLDTDGARKEVDRWKEDGAEVRRTYHKGMKDEKERWAPLRSKMMDEKKAGGPDYDAAKWKKKFDTAKAKHDATEHALKFNLIKQLAEISPRFSPLIDMDGRTYYLHTPSLRKPPAKSTRDDFVKWTWFVAVWGARPSSAKRVDISALDSKTDEKVEDSDSLSDLTESESEGDKRGHRQAQGKKTGKAASQEGWWAFGDANEVKNLAKWIQWRDQEVNGSTGGSEGGSPDEDGEEDDEKNGSAPGFKPLVNALNDFAAVLQYADDVVAK